MSQLDMQFHAAFLGLTAMLVIGLYLIGCFFCGPMWKQGKEGIIATIVHLILFVGCVAGSIYLKHLSEMP